MQLSILIKKIISQWNKICYILCMKIEDEEILQKLSKISKDGKTKQERIRDHMHWCFQIMDIRVKS